MSSIKLSINVNKIALIRNSREGNNPDLETMASRILDAGAHGITVHPRPDQRHVRPEDCELLSQLIRRTKERSPNVEFNIEGNPYALKSAAPRADFNDYPGFLSIVEHCLPDQVTLVPDADNQLTSDHGFDLSKNTQALSEIIQRLKQCNCRVSLFMDADPEQIKRVADIDADRIELYTGPFAQSYDNNIDEAERLFEQHCLAAETAHNIGLGVNAGHDLNLHNLTRYQSLPHLAEVSIGHAFTIDALNLGIDKTVEAYIGKLQ